MTSQQRLQKLFQLWTLIKAVLFQTLQSVSHDCVKGRRTLPGPESVKIYFDMSLGTNNADLTELTNCQYFVSVILWTQVLDVTAKAERMCVFSYVRLFRNPTDCSPPSLLCPQNFPDKNTGVGCHFLLQGMFPNQGLNSHLLHTVRHVFI